VSYASANTLAGNQLVFQQVNSAKWLIYKSFWAFHSAGKRFASGTALFRSTRSLTEWTHSAQPSAGFVYRF
jgi:hypothetical protein